MAPSPAAAAGGSAVSAAKALAKAVKPLDWVNGAVTVAKEALPNAYAKTGLSQGVEKDELRPGDHIYAWRLGFTYQDHGVVVKVKACDESADSSEHLSLSCCAVVHFRPPADGDRGCIELVSLAEFAQGREVCRVRYGVQDAEFYLRRSGCVATEHPDAWPIATFRALGLLRAPPLPGSAAAAESESEAAAELTPEEEVEYDMLSKNSELLARWCQLGAASGVRHFRSSETARSLQTSHGRFLRLGLAAAAVTTAGAVGAAVATGALGGGAAASSAAAAAAGSAGAGGAAAAAGPAGGATAAGGAAAGGASGAAATAAGAAAGAGAAEGAAAVAVAAAARAVGKEIATSLAFDALRNPKKAMGIFEKAVQLPGSGPKRLTPEQEIARRREQDDAITAAFADCLAHIGVLPPKVVATLSSSSNFCCRLSALLVDVLEAEKPTSVQGCAAVVQRFLDDCQLPEGS